MASGEFYRGSYTPDYQEMFAMARASYRYHYTRLQRLTYYLTLVALVGLIMVVSEFDTALEDLVEPLLGPKLVRFAAVPVFVAFLWLWIWGVCYKLLPYLSARWMAERKQPRALVFSADAEMLRWENADSGMWVRWSEIERLFVTKDAVGFLCGGWTYYIPQRAFGSPVEFVAFLETAVSKLSPGARVLSEADRTVRQLLSKK